MLFKKRIKKNNKLIYFLRAFAYYKLPKWMFFLQKKITLTIYSKQEQKEIKERVDYYNKIVQSSLLNENNSCTISTFKNSRKQRKPSTYFFDSYEHLRWFSHHFRFSYAFGDVTHIPSIPSFVKSRPISGENNNAVLLNLDKVRHFLFIHDTIPFSKKKDKLIGRAVVAQPHRIRFWEQYSSHPMCNLGDVDKRKLHPEWQNGFVSLEEHLTYKFILCIEGNDVATNLKWVMSSNSLPVMPKPKYETWFMEGKLRPNYHYILIKDDYSDLEERLNYYLQHEDKALEIIQHAHEYIQQFKDTRKERLISHLIIEKYFNYTQQNIR